MNEEELCWSQLRIQNWLQGTEVVLIESLVEALPTPFQDLQARICPCPKEVPYIGVDRRYLSAEGVMAETPSPKRRMITNSGDVTRTAPG